MATARGRQNARGAPACLALDIGTEYVKAVVVSPTPQPVVLGVGRARQQAGDMEGGAISRIAGVVESCRHAIDEACLMASVQPTKAIVGIAGEFVQGCTISAQFRRRRPNRLLNEGEFKKMLAHARGKALEEARRMLSERTGLANLDVELVDTALTEVRIDGYRVKNPLEFQGSYVELNLFHTFSPLVHIGALRTVAERLKLQLQAAVAEPYAVAMGALSEEAYEAGAVVIDIGGGSTDIAVVRDRAVSATKSFPVGGRAFTRSLALHFRLDFNEAEALKLDYAAGVLDDDIASEVEEVLTEDLKIYYDGLKLCLHDLAAQAPLPARLFLSGGGAALPGMIHFCATTSWEEGVFRSPPQVCSLTADDVKHIADPKALLAGERDVTPKSLSLQAVQHGQGQLDVLSAVDALG